MNRYPVEVESDQPLILKPEDLVGREGPTGPQGAEGLRGPPGASAPVQVIPVQLVVNVVLPAPKVQYVPDDFRCRYGPDDPRMLRHLDELSREKDRLISQVKQVGKSYDRGMVSQLEKVFGELSARILRDRNR